ncbi:hypothetical protein TNCV_1786271 [Trichonephila clavipes]|nr:hypothetical protein TNCV_1786271 [Trichonephila clavipes]
MILLRLSQERDEAPEVWALRHPWITGDIYLKLAPGCLLLLLFDERVSQNEREVTSEQKIELAKLQLAKLEKEIELQLAKNKALSLNPAAKVEEKQFETNIENMIKV